MSTQFEQIIVKTGEGGGITRLGDVARIELGGKSYDLTSRLNGAPSASIAIYQLPGANALDVAKRVYATMDELAGLFPAGVSYVIPYDTTVFVEESIKEVYVTLFEAAALVFLVLFVFLQDWRATLIPAVAIPVSLIGTFAAMGALGFSLNMLTLFGLVLAIGIVVDDAIVVVEATAAHIERGLSSKEAAIKAMSEVSGPVVATTLVLLAVFVPAAFLPGITGELYRQFALTIAVSTLFSTLNALTMSPALCALLLRPPKEKKNAFFRGFDAVFRKLEGGYRGVTHALVRRAAIVMLLFVVLAGLTGWQFGRLPTGFLPLEDQGYLMIAAQLPDAASLERTSKVLDQIDGILQDVPGVEQWVTFGGYSMIDGTSASNAGIVFVILEPWDERTDSSLSAGGDPDPSAGRSRRHPGCDRVRLSAAGDPGPGRLGRLPDAAPGPRRRRPGRAGAGCRRDRRRRRRPIGAHQPQHHVPRQRPAAVRGGRPHQGQAAGGLAERAVRHAAGLSRLGLRQRLQPLRPHLAGQDPGRSPLPAGAGGHPPARGAQRPGRHGAGRHAGRRRAHPRAPDHPALQPLPRPPRSPARPPPASARARR